MEPKAKTLIERMGFLDADRKRNSHDEMQIWVYRNFKSIIMKMYPLVKYDDRPMEIKLEYPITDIRRNFVVGFVDVFCKKHSIGIEVKTEIPVVGELIRQIQFYRQYTAASWIVVSPDDKNAEILKEQGIRFLKYNVGHCNKRQLKLFELYQ